MKEQVYQKNIIKYLHNIGAYTVKVSVATKSGVPDILACYKGVFIGIEVKTPSTINNASELQKYNIAEIIKAGGYAMVAVYPTDLEDIVKEIDEAINARVGK